VLRQAISITGTEQQRKSLAELKRSAPEAFAAAVYVAVSSVASTAMRLTPVDTGWLRQSRYVTKPRTRSATFSIDVGFAATYAAAVHEVDRRYVVGEWKFLDKAARYHEPTLLGEIQRMTAGFMASRTTIDGVPKLHPDRPMDKTNRAALEGLASRYRRKRSRATAQKREIAAGRNQERIARESDTALAAQREGRRPPRPGRG